MPGRMAPWQPPSHARFTIRKQQLQEQRQQQQQQQQQLVEAIAKVLEFVGVVLVVVQVQKIRIWHALGQGQANLFNINEYELGHIH